MGRTQRGFPEEMKAKWLPFNKIFSVTIFLISFCSYFKSQNISGHNSDTENNYFQWSETDRQIWDTMINVKPNYVITNDGWTASNTGMLHAGWHQRLKDENYQYNNHIFINIWQVSRTKPISKSFLYNNYKIIMNDNVYIWKNTQKKKLFSIDW